MAILNKILFILSVSAHHKSKEALEHRNPILKWYYSVYILFGYCCVGTEIFYVLLFVLKHVDIPLLHQVSFYDLTHCYSKHTLYMMYSSNRFASSVACLPVC